MLVPPDLRYTTSHEWARREGADVVAGITPHAQEGLRGVGFLELPKVGRGGKQGGPVAVIESVKAAFDIYAPVSGTVARVNDTAAKSPQLVNQDCYGSGWLFAITPGTPKELDGLLSSEAYIKQIEAGAH